MLRSGAAYITRSTADRQLHGNSEVLSEPPTTLTCRRFTERGYNTAASRESAIESTDSEKRETGADRQETSGGNGSIDDLINQHGDARLPLQFH
ncbi:hypothetical protein EYF80_034058 [Liparis tanakae]|uniref:Uncharacterized protein n=1 Tax=Liparis tanakae TaxID=230148 RepID=A0A4Z2GSD9_9TELE|nr:hypothetical protein EYF80_034058 [Liparis tanakae]